MKRFFLESLVLDIYLIGYKQEGESIVFIIKTDEKISFCGVVDCYEQSESLNKTLDLIEELMIEKLDFFCWTHPDLDHSLGIKKLLEKFDLSDTIIVLPENISGMEYEYHSEVIETFKRINDGIRPRRGKPKLHVKSASDYKILNFLEFLSPTNELIQMTIKSIAPDSTIVRSRRFTTSGKKNDYSIGLVLNIGEIDVLLMGDVENTTINAFEDYYIPEKVEYIKVPHHTSKGSNKLLQFLNKDNKTEVACTTIYKKHNLPDRELITHYKDFAQEFYSTGDINAMPEHDYGIIKTTIDIRKKTFSVRLQGNSYRAF